MHAFQSHIFMKASEFLELYINYTPKFGQAD